MDKILICQPIGGINDLLCQIGICIEYAEKYNRKLIIDTSMSDMNDHFSNYFNTNNLGKNIQLKLNKCQMHLFSKDPLFPNYFLLSDESNTHYTSILPDRDCSEKYIIHRTFGGGGMSFYALKYFKLNNYLIKKIKKKKEMLGEYHAVMIRHTDYNSDYEKILAELEQMQIDVPLFLFTDNYKVQDYARTLSFKKLIVNENLFKSDAPNTPIMHSSRFLPNVTPKMINDEVLTDLFLAALSEHIYPTYISGFCNSREFEDKQISSGFVNLAIHLNTNRRLLNNILTINFPFPFNLFK